MHFPVGWDPYFKDVMTVADVYHYPTSTTTTTGAYRPARSTWLSAPTSTVNRCDRRDPCRGRSPGGELTGDVCWSEL